MERTIKKQKLIITATSIILLASIITIGLLYKINEKLSNNLNTKKLNSEIMLSEKLILQREIDAFRTKIVSLSGKNTELDETLIETTKKLNEKEAQLSKIVRENGNIKSLKKQIAELSQMKKEFETKISSYNNDIQKLNNENTELNKTIASLKEQNDQLASNLQILSSMTADNYFVETTKRKDRLTINSKQAKKMAVSFKVPENVAEKISFKITKPDGSQVEGKENGIAYNIIIDESSLLASTSKDEIRISKKIEMTYEPKEKLKPGIYKIEVFNAEKYIGSCNVKLR